MSSGFVAGIGRPSLGVPHPVAWLHGLWQLLARELAPSPQKLRTALRIATVGTFGAAAVVSCHVNNEIGTYLVWLVAGAGPMMSARKAIVVLAAEGLALIFALVTARAFAETPWLMLPFLLAIYSVVTYFGTCRKLGALLLIIQVVTLNTYYGVVFAPQAVGWAAAGAFGGTAIALGTLVLFDNWLWPDPGEPLLLTALSTSVARTRSRLLNAAAFYLDANAGPQPPVPPPTTDLPEHMALLERVVTEGVSENRRALLLAAITRVARISLEVDRLTVSARETVPRGIRSMLRPQLDAAVDAIAGVLDEITREFRTTIPVGPDVPPPPSRRRARAAMDALTQRIIVVRPLYLGRASAAEIANFASFADSLATLTSFIERLLDAPPLISKHAVPRNITVRDTDLLDDPMLRYSLKVGLCIVIGYVIGLITQRVDLSTILTTVVITAQPTYGAAARKMILRIVGAAIGGAVSLLVIIAVSPNFSTLPAYVIAVFIIFLISGYGSLSSGRIAYAGKQIGTTFALIFTGLSPASDVYAPLWRMWGIFLGTFVVAAVALIIWPEYAGDSLLPRLRRVIVDTLRLIPSQDHAKTENELQQTNAETMSALAEILEVATDAELEGRSSVVDSQAIVEAAGTLRRIANRLTSICVGRIAGEVPSLDAETEAARQSVFAALERQLRSWLVLLTSCKSLSSGAGATASTYAHEESEEPLKQFGSRIEQDNYFRTASWSLDHRRTLLAELQSMRRIVFLMPELNRYLSRISSPAAHKLAGFR